MNGRPAFRYPSHLKNCLGLDSLGLLVMGVVVGRRVGPLQVLRLEPVLCVIFEKDFVQAVRRAAVRE